MKKILRFLIGVSLGILALCFSCSRASAEETPVSHSEDVTYTTVYHTSSDWQIAVTTDSWNYCPEPTQTNWIGGNAERDIKTLYVAPYPTTIEGTGSSTAGYYMSLYDSIQGYYNPPVPNFNITLTDCTVILDTDLLPAGYYRYIFHFWYGVAFSNANSVSTNIEPSYLGTSSYTEGNSSIIFEGLEQCQNYFAGGSYPFRSDLLEFTFDTVFYCDGNTSETEFNIGYYISQLGKQIVGYEMDNYSIGRLYYLNIWANNRYYSELYGNVEPPVSPTPTPTPSPNQDIINNSNTNTTNIITNINDGFDDLTNFMEDSLPGFIANAIFGDPVDWVEFLVEVQGDLLDFIPLSDLVDELIELFVSFYGNSLVATNPLNLQFIEGWKSDLYTLEIPALPLVINGTEYTFIPNYRFSFNNAFMNLIRPYVLTFMNVLITILFLRYLIDYFYRWTQLVAGNTSVAFQILHHDEAEKDHVEGQDFVSSGYHAKSNNSYERDYPDEYYDSLIKIHRNE